MLSNITKSILFYFIALMFCCFGSKKDISNNRDKTQIKGGTVQTKAIKVFGQEGK